MSQERIRKIIISEETFKKMKEELIEQLQKEEDIELVVAPVGSIHDQKMMQHIANGGSCVVITSKKETSEIEYICEELMKNVKIPELCAQPIKEHNKSKKKYNIPRTIGKPNSIRKGGR